MLSEEDKRELLTLARQAIRCRLEKSGPPSDAPVYSRRLCSQCGVFISLYVKGELRGCIGTFADTEPLYRNVIEMAVCAATSDGRFRPLRKEEIVDLEIEISVLSPRRKITSVTEIIPGKHGILMESGTHSGTLLPQVAKIQGWSLEELLSNCSKYKAGIGWDGWKSADLYIYEATVFSSGGKQADVKIS